MAEITTHIGLRNLMIKINLGQFVIYVAQ